MRNVIGIISIFAGLMMIGVHALAGAAITYHGRILDANDQPVQALNVIFKIQVRSPGTPNCLLYEETRTVNMTGSDGIFVIPIGDGSGARTANDPHITIENVFSNNTALNHTSLDCNSGTSYQPGALDSRRMVVSFNDGSGSGEQALPAMDVNYVPFALHTEEASSALKIGTTPASQVMSVASGAATPLSAANFAELLLLVNGSSTAYLKPASVPSCANGEVLKGTAGAFVCVTDASGTDTLAGISCADGKILKRISGSWACADESGVGTESDPTVQAYAKVAPGSGLTVSGGVIVADFGTAAGKVAQGNDSRFTDSRAPNGSATGDLSGSYPNPTVKGIRGNAVNASAPADAQVYKWVTGSSEFQPKYVGLADLRKADGSPQIPQCNANANETLIYTSVSDTFTCTAINNLDAAKITSGTIAYGRLPIGTAANTVAAGDDSRFTNSRAPSGSAGGELGGTYPNPTVAKLAGVALNVAALSSGQVLKYDGTNWVNAPDVGVGSETDPSVQQYAKNAPGTGLKVTSNLIVPDFGTGAGKVVEGNDSRLSDNRVASDLNSVVSTGIVQRTGAGAFSTLGVSAPVTNSGTNIGLAVGAGLTLNTGSLVPDFGTASGKVAQGNDSRFPSSTCASGNYNRWNGSAWVCDADASTDASKVAKTGDTMSGALTVSAGINIGGSGDLSMTRTDTRMASIVRGNYAAGTADRIGIQKAGGGQIDMFAAYADNSYFSGSVGIGTASPTAKLHVAGTAGTDGIRFPDGTLQTTAYTGGAAGETLVSLTDGATINVDASTGRTFAVTIAGNRTIASPTNLTAGAVYRFIVKQDATGGRGLTWGSAFKMPGGSEPADVYTVATAIPGATGTVIGNMTSGGGLAAAFDGVTSQSDGAGAYNGVAGNGTTGKDWGAGVTKRVVRFRAVASNNYGFQNPANGSVTLVLEGSPDNSAWNQLYSTGAMTDSAGLVVDVSSGINSTFGYRYHRLRIVSNGSDGDDRLAELTFYEGGANGGKTTVYQFISDGTNLFLISKMDTM